MLVCNWTLGILFLVTFDAPNVMEIVFPFNTFGFLILFLEECLIVFGGEPNGAYKKLHPKDKDKILASNSTNERYRAETV